MDDEAARDDDPIKYFTEQYSQAVQALETIRVQAPALIAMGRNSELSEFVERFIQMASRAAADADEKKLANYAAWFLELVRKAEEMKIGIGRH